MQPRFSNKVPRWLVLPFIWMTTFYLIPTLLVVAYSFQERASNGGIDWVFSVSNYSLILDSSYLPILVRTFSLAGVTALLTLLLCLPLALFIARQSRAKGNVLLMLALFPFWTNFLVRIYAWLIILGDNGLLNSTLLGLGILDEPVQLLFTSSSVLVGLVYNYMPFMLLPVFASIVRIDKSVVDAAADLGSGKIQTIFRVVIPLSSKGIVTGFSIVFIMCLGEFVTPDLLGGAKVHLLGNVVKNQYLMLRDWPLGSAFAIVIVVIVAMLVYTRLRMETKLA